MICSLKGLIVLERRSDWNCIKSDSCLMKINIIGIIAGFPWTFCKSEPTRHSVFSCSSCNSNILQWWSCILYSIFSELWGWKCVCCNWWPHKTWFKLGFIQRFCIFNAFPLFGLSFGRSLAEHALNLYNRSILRPLLLMSNLIMDLHSIHIQTKRLTNLEIFVDLHKVEPNAKHVKPIFDQCRN